MSKIKPVTSLNEIKQEILNSIDFGPEDVKGWTHRDPPLTIPAFTLSERYLYSMLAKNTALFGRDISDELRKKARELKDDYEEYMNYSVSLFTEKTKSEISTLLSRNFKPSEEIKKKVREVGNMEQLFDACFLFETAKRFLYHVDHDTYVDFSKLPDLTEQYKFEDCFDEIEDMMLGFSLEGNHYSPIYFRIAKSTSNLSCKKGDNIPYFNLTIYSVKGKKEQDILGEIIIAKDMYPKVLMIDSIHSLCPYRTKNEALKEEDGCKRRIHMEVARDCRSKELSTKSFCYMSKKKMDEYACLLSDFYIHKVLSIFAYIWDMYKNRKTITRKNSPRKNTYEKNPVTTIINDIESDNATQTEYKEIALGALYKYEYERKEWQGGHHQSPIEHERREHDRIYRNPDGSIKKITRIKSSTINKGNHRAVYKVPTIKKEKGDSDVEKREET